MAERWRVTRCRCETVCRQWVVLDPGGRKVRRVPTLVLAYPLAALEADGRPAAAREFGLRIGAGRAYRYA